MATHTPIPKTVPPPDVNSLLQTLLSPLGYLYGKAFELWLYLHEHRVVKARSLDVPVISIGNITVGGTGKTPFTQYLASHLRGSGRRVAILSRGYGSQSAEGWLLVSDGERTYRDPREVGDEPFLLAKNLEGIPVVVGRNRFRAGQFAVQKLGCDVVVLDDGFQHLHLQRDLDIALLDSTNPFGNHKAIPAGILREPVRGLSRAGLLVLTRVDQARGLDELRGLLRELNPEAPIVEAVHKPLGMFSLGRAEAQDLGLVRNRRVIALSSLGNPGSFERTLSDLGSFLVRRIRYPDHYPYSATDLDFIAGVFRDSKADLVVSTEKDGVRLKGLDPSLPILVLKVGIEVVRGEHVLKSSLESVLRSES